MSAMPHKTGQERRRKSPKQQLLVEFIPLGVMEKEKVERVETLLAELLIEAYFSNTAQHAQEITDRD